MDLVSLWAQLLQIMKRKNDKILTSKSWQAHAQLLSSNKP